MPEEHSQVNTFVASHKAWKLPLSSFSQIKTGNRYNNKQHFSHHTNIRAHLFTPSMHWLSCLSCRYTDGCRYTYILIYMQFTVYMQSYFNYNKLSLSQWLSWKQYVHHSPLATSTLVSLKQSAPPSGPVLVFTGGSLASIEPISLVRLKEIGRNRKPGLDRTSFWTTTKLDTINLRKPSLDRTCFWIKKIWCCTYIHLLCRVQLQHSQDWHF